MIFFFFYLFWLFFYIYNFHYIIIFNNPRDTLGLLTLVEQPLPGKKTKTKTKKTNKQLLKPTQHAMVFASCLNTVSENL